MEGRDGMRDRRNRRDRGRPTLTPAVATRVAPALLLLVVLILAACGSGDSAALRHPTPTPTIPPPVIYVALGASDAVGVGATDPNTRGYIPLIIAHLPAHSRALNLGISGILQHDALTKE